MKGAIFGLFEALGQPRAKSKRVQALCAALGSIDDEVMEEDDGEYSLSEAEGGR